MQERHITTRRTLLTSLHQSVRRKPDEGATRGREVGQRHQMGRGLASHCQMPRPPLPSPWPGAACSIPQQPALWVSLADRGED